MNAEFNALKQRQQAAWASGDFAVVGVTLQIVGESLAEAADVRAGERVIDIAAGNGNATLAAAHRFAQVTSTDYVPALPFEDASFDVALSTFGVMFTPDHARAAAEMLRVVRGGGRIGMANWTPDGLVGQLFKTIGKHLPPPAGIKSPALWGTEEYLRGLFGAAAAHWLQVFRDYYGPVHKAFAALDEQGVLALEQELFALLDRFNTAGEASLVAPGEYLEVVVRHG